MKIPHILRHSLIILTCSMAAATAAEVSAKDEMFLQGAAQDGMTEVALGKIASDQAANPRIKAFGALMVKDHTAIGDKLKIVAANVGVPIPPALDKEHTEMVVSMGKLAGKDFDNTYVTDMVKGHQAAVSDFETAAKNAENPAIKAFATETLPTLKGHLRKIEAIQKSM